MLTRTIQLFATASLLCAAASPAAFAQDEHHHEGDLIVGITGPTAAEAERLAVEGDFDEAVQLEPVSALLDGWTSVSPGFDALSTDELAEPFFTLASGAQVWLEIVSIDSGLSVVQAGGGAIADAAGESIFLGGWTLHSHPTWYAQRSELGDVWLGTLSATFRLIDRGATGFGDSEPFTLTFTNVPEPASLVLAAMAAGPMLMRRRGR